MQQKTYILTYQAMFR